MLYFHFLRIIERWVGDIVFTCAYLYKIHLQKCATYLCVHIKVQVIAKNGGKNKLNKFLIAHSWWIVFKLILKICGHSCFFVLLQFIVQHFLFRSLLFFFFSLLPFGFLTAIYCILSLSFHWEPLFIVVIIEANGWMIWKRNPLAKCSCNGKCIDVQEASEKKKKNEKLCFAYTFYELVHITRFCNLQRQWLLYKTPKRLPKL